MKATINKKRYDSDKCDSLGSYNHYNDDNICYGGTELLEASDGTLLVHTTLDSGDNTLCLWDSGTEPMAYFEMSERQEARCVELGLIKIIE